MIILAVLSDKMVDGERKAKGRQVREVIDICVDNFNILIAKNGVGQKFFGKLAHLHTSLSGFGIDVEAARRLLLDFFDDFAGSSVGDLSWAEMDDRFLTPQRVKDSSGHLALTAAIKKKRGGKMEDDEEVAEELVKVSS